MTQPSPSETLILTQLCGPLQDGKSGRTPLHHAVETENTNIIAELLKYGANPSEQSFSGNTPIQIASGRGMQSIRQLLENAAKGIPVEDKQVKICTLFNATVEFIGSPLCGERFL